MQKYLFPFSLLLILFIFSCGPQPARENKALSQSLRSSLDQNFADAAAQYHVLMNNLPSDKFPKAWSEKTGRYEFSGSDWWTSGFYPGTLVRLFEQTGDSSLLNEAKRMLTWLEIEQYNTRTQGLGFVMMSGFGNAYRVFPNTWYKDILITSAKTMISRFNPKVGCIRSATSPDPADFLVNIDNMMNLELLFWVSKETGNRQYYDIAVTHANTTLKNHFREDDSSWQILNYNPETGAVKEQKTEQGASDDSAWSRGQAWGLYGFTVVYRETKDPVFLEHAQKIARFIIRHRNLPDDKIPYWDFSASDLRDASAGAVLASALLELSGFVADEDAKEYIAVAEIILHSLSNEPYKAAPGTNGGFILKHSVGHKPRGTEVDVALAYADYYYVEALARYRELGN